MDRDKINRKLDAINVKLTALDEEVKDICREVKAIHWEMDEDEWLPKVGDWVTSLTTGKVSQVTRTLNAGFRKATPQEILDEIAKFKVGEEVYDLIGGHFIKIMERRYTHAEGVDFIHYIGYGENGQLCEHTANIEHDSLERRPRPKWEVGQKLRCKGGGYIIVETIEWDYDEKTWRYCDGVCRYTDRVLHQ